MLVFRLDIKMDKKKISLSIKNNKSHHEPRTCSRLLRDIETRSASLVVYRSIFHQNYE